MNRQDVLSSIDRVRLANLPTPLEKLSNMSGCFTSAIIYIKRDDQTGNCFGGNKERKLEFIFADALKNGATVVITVGALQSNHCRMTAAFANKLGLRTELILIEKDEEISLGAEGNVFLDILLGAKIHRVKINEVQSKIDQVMSDLQNKGEKPYFIEGGGHNSLGVMGYVQAVKELMSQIEAMGVHPDYLVLPIGTGTTQAGLVLGADMFGFQVKIIGISVSRNKERCIEEVVTVIRSAQEHLGLEIKDLSNNIHVYDDYIGNGYGIFTSAGKQALKLLAEKEGMLVDPVYNAKAFAGLLDLVGNHKISGNIIYLNTGGIPVLFSGRRIKEYLGVSA